MVLLLPMEESTQYASNIKGTGQCELGLRIRSSVEISDCSYFCRHVSSTDKVGKRYRNMSSVFSIGDDDDGGEIPFNFFSAKILVEYGCVSSPK